MKSRLFVSLVGTLIILASSSLNAESAQSYIERARLHEQNNDFSQAALFYKKAYDLKETEELTAVANKGLAESLIKAKLLDPESEQDEVLEAVIAGEHTSEKQP